MMLVFLVIFNLAMASACQEEATTTTICPHKTQPTTTRPTRPTRTTTVPSRPDDPSCFKKPVDIALVIDSTASMNYETNFTLGLNFIKEFLDQFDISPTSTRVAAVMFGEGVYTDSVIPFDQYTNKQETLNAISKLQWKHAVRTDTNLGIEYMVNKFLPYMRPDNNVAHLGIVLTDGQSSERELTRKAAQRARDAGITMIAIGIGKPVRNPLKDINGELNMDLLEEIPGDKDFVLTVGDFFKLRSITNKLTEKICYVAMSMEGKRPTVLN